MSVGKIIDKMPNIAISLLIFFAILTIGGIFMYKSADVATDILDNTTHEAEIAQRADSFNTAGDSTVTVITVLVSLLIIFALISLIMYMIKSLRSKGGGNADI